MARPKVLIVDDHEQFRAIARRLLAAEGFDVVGEAADGTSALLAVSALHPDIVLVDVQLPDCDGFRIADELASLAQRPQVVLTSTRAAAEYGSRMKTTTACGFIPKVELSGDAIHGLVDDAFHASGTGG